MNATNILLLIALAIQVVTLLLLMRTSRNMDKAVRNLERVRQVQQRLWRRWCDDD